MTKKENCRLIFSRLAWLLGIVGGLFLLVIGVMAAFDLRITLQASSIPGIWQCRKLPLTTEIKVGDVVTFDSAWDDLGMKLGYTLFNAPIMKEVVGVSGQKVTLEGDQVSIDGVPIKGCKILKADSRGTILPHPEYPYVIPEGSYFLVSQNRTERGWDSRYFGPVPRDKFIEICRLVMRI